MGGIPILLCGDFTQVLPVVKNGTRANIVNANLKMSHLWGNIKVMKLITKMRAHLSGDDTSASFSRLLLAIGDGQIPLVAEPDTIAIPTELGKCVTSLQYLKSEVYPNLGTNCSKSEWLAERAIISPFNTNVNSLNICLMKQFPGEERVYRSIDTAISDEEAVKYPVEFLNSLDADPHSHA